MTLLEILIAMAILSLAMGGVLACLLQNRRLTEGSVLQNSALTIVQGYIEQMKSMDLAELVGGSDSKGNPVLNTASHTITTYIDDAIPDSLTTSTGTPPALSTLTPGVTPTLGGFVDNLKNFDMLKDTTDTTLSNTDAGNAAARQTSWISVWPRAANYPANTIGATDLKLNVWVWLSDLSGSSPNAQKVFGVTLIYSWQFLDGAKPRYGIGSIRMIRSSVPTT